MRSKKKFIYILGFQSHASHASVAFLINFYNKANVLDKESRNIKDARITVGIEKKRLNNYLKLAEKY